MPSDCEQLLRDEIVRYDKLRMKEIALKYGDGCGFHEVMEIQALTKRNYAAALLRKLLDVPHV
jgi:hypothetical protein